MDRTSTTTYKTVYNIRLSPVLHPALVAKLWSFSSSGSRSVDCGVGTKDPQIGYCGI